MCHIVELQTLHLPKHVCAIHYFVVLQIEFLPEARCLAELGFVIYATPGTYDFLRQSEHLSDQEDEEALEEAALLAKNIDDQENGLLRKDNSRSSALKGAVNTSGKPIPEWFRGRLIKAHKALQKPDASELIESGTIGIVINVSGSLRTRTSESAGYYIRRAAVNAGGNRCCVVATPP